MPLPPKLDQIVRLMAGSPKDLKIEALLDYSRRVPPLPDHIQKDDLEQVHECMTPFFVLTEVDDDGGVHFFFEAPAESPTIRGFAGILIDGLDGETVESVQSVPEDFFHAMGLDDVITPQRLNGMVAILRRIKRQLAA